MIKLKNNKNIAVTFDGMILPPLASISMTKEDWGKLYAKKAIRECIALGYMTAETIVETKKKSTNNNKEKE